jgi:regulatory protein
MARSSSERFSKRAPKPLTEARLDELALAYVARFATSRGRLEAYLLRKLRERGWEGEGEPPLTALIERFSAAGYVDDTAYALARSGSLLRRGYGEKRVAQALGAAGIDESVRASVRASEGAQRRAALAMARRRGFGPFGAALASSQYDRKLREKQIAAMLRAGHGLDSARQLVDAASVEAAGEWAALGQEGDGCD